MTTSKKAQSLDVMEMDVGTADFYVLGKTPMILHRMPEKAKWELLMPKGRKTAAERQRSLKHNPYEEYRSSPYTVTDDDAPTRIVQRSYMFKAAIRGAGRDVPGATKAQLGRLLWVEDENVSIFGDVQLLMSVTRSADINKTPDIRTRAIMPCWACRVSVSFVQPTLNVKTVGNLMAAAGLTQGIGDWRPEKGSGNYGQYDLVGPDDERYQDICAKFGREHQDNALANPVCYDTDTDELLSWFDDAADERGLTIVGGRDAA